MTLPTSGPLTLADIQTEFGGSNPISLSEYYAGGAYVPAGSTGTYGPVPSSGAISIRNFYGTNKAIQVTTGSDVIVIPGTTLSYYGYYGPNTAGPFLFGSIENGVFNGATIKAVFSSYYNGTGKAANYTIVFSGNRSASFFHTLTINGTLVVGTLSAPTYNSTNNDTSFTISVAVQDTLFGTVDGAVIPIIVT